MFTSEMRHQLYPDYGQVQGEVSVVLSRVLGCFIVRQLPSLSFDMQSVLARRPRFLIFIHNQQDTQMRWTDSNIILPSVKHKVKNITKPVPT